VAQQQIQGGARSDVFRGLGHGEVIIQEKPGALWGERRAPSALLHHIDPWTSGAIAPSERLVFLSNSNDTGQTRRDVSYCVQYVM
jgi:hypothetical protein